MTMPGFTAAALAGVPAGVQAQGVWVGRRQLFVKFAGEAETATMYSSDALAREMQRHVQRGMFHSVSVTGRDPLANREFLVAALTKAQLGIPVMLDSDGQRPDETALLTPHVALVQVTLDPAASHGMLEHAYESLRVAARATCAHAFVVAASVETSDSQVLRAVEHARDASAETDVVLLPPISAESSVDRRWAVLLDQAMQLHIRTTLGARILPPAGMR
jgi:organic radical activating enzyme